MFYKEINKTNVGVTRDNIKYGTAYAHGNVLIILI
jgi:hypothetical protein